MKLYVYLLLDDFAFMRPVCRLAAAERLGCTGVDAEFKAKDRSEGASFIECIPVSFDCDQGLFNFR